MSEDSPMARPATAKCPICGRPVTAAHRPLCSARCRQVDLGRWLGEAYRIPAAEAEDPDQDEAPDAADDPEPGRD